MSSSPSEKRSTPQDYLELTFPLPKSPWVGMLACQRDPLLSTLTTTVLRCDKVEKALPAAAAKGKKGKKDAAPSPPAEEPRDEWEIELADTVLFPEGGGQPSDTGLLIPLDEAGTPKEGEAALVREVIRRNLDAVHFASKPFPVGSQVVASVDMERRTDHMCMHTGQHLLSAVFERDYGLDTLSWSLQKYPEPCYVELPRAPTPEEIAAVQKKCNDIICEGRKVRVRMELATKENGVRLGDKVPENYRDAEGSERPPVQRTVTIDDLDENPCCGTHYPDLSYLRSLFISPYTTPIRGQNARVYFVVGPRVLTFLSSSHQIARSSALEAGCNPADLSERVSALVSGLADLKRKEKRLKEELAGYVAKDLWDEALKSAHSGGDDETTAVLRGLSFREEDATNALEFLGAVASDLKTRCDALSETPPRRQLFILACGGTSGSTGATSGAVVIFGTEELVVKAGKMVVEKLGGKIKGGGKGRWQGKVTDRWEAGDKEKLEKVLEEATA
ncbi:hypothetical protein JCM1840_002657 [Sporobolomyces johnsonii]